MEPRPSHQHHQRGSTRGRGRGRGRSTQTHTNSNSNSNSNHTHTHPPPHHLLHPSTPVAIILKQDQPTGHRVTGLIATVLTRGNHPRGVKVRLRDGRVGRVQAVVGLREGMAGEGVAGVGVGVDVDVGLGGRVERDGRELELDGYLYGEGRERGSEVSLGLFAALEDADRGVVRGMTRGRRGGRRRRGRSTTVESDAQVPKEHSSGVETVKCPVCGAFEGDETAVAHHVEEHFGS